MILVSKNKEKLSYKLEKLPENYNISKIKKPLNLSHFRKNMLDIFLYFARLYPAMSALSAYLPYIQIIIAILLIAAVLMQQSDSSAGGAFGGADNWNAGYHTRRGSEKILFNITIVLAILFAIISLVSVILG